MSVLLPVISNTVKYIVNDFCNRASHTQGAVVINLSELGSPHSMGATKETASDARF